MIRKSATVFCALILAASLTACKKQAEPTPTPQPTPTATPVATSTATPASTPTAAPASEPAVSAEYDYDAYKDRITNAYSGVLEDADENQGGTAYFAIADDGMMAVVYTDNAGIYISSVFSSFETEDDRMRVTDVRNGEELVLVLMPMEDDDAYSISFIEQGVSGFITPCEAGDILAALQQ